MTLDNSGNLLVGATTASGRLTVTAAVSQRYGTFDAPTAGYAGTVLNYNGTKYGAFGQSSFAITGGSNTDFGLAAVNNLIFGTNGTTEAMRINSSGNVGIGTSSPSYALDVNGQSRVYAGITISPQTNSLYTVDGSLSYYGSGNGVYLNGNSAGFLGLRGDGSGNGSSSIQLYGATSGTPNTMTFFTNSAERMRIDSSGNVGIGTSSPSYLLHVNGTTYSSSDVRAPIFYDSDNTGYYVDPSPGSNGISANFQGRVIVGTFNNSQTNSGEAWFGRASNRNSGTFTIQLGGGSSSNRKFEIVDYAWSTVLFTADSGGNVTASANITAYSDLRLKENIQVIPNALSKVQKIRGITYTRNDVEDKNTRYAGVIAQEVKEVLPEVVMGSEETQYSVAYGNMVGLLIEAIKEQQLQIDELKAKINGTS